MRAILEILLLSTKQKQEDRLLDIVGPIDRRRERLRQKGEHVPSLREFVNVTDIGIGQGCLRNASTLLRRQQDDVVRDELGSTTFEPVIDQRV